MSSLASQKRLASRVMKISPYRVRLKETKEVEEALTANDIRDLIKKGMIWKVQKKGQKTTYSRKRREQKKKGRRKGPGSKKGEAGSRTHYKTAWLNSVRPLRKLLLELKTNKQIEQKEYRKLYLKIKGGFFRNKKHILFYLKDNEMLIGKKPKKPAAKKEVKKEKSHEKAKKKKVPAQKKKRAKN